LLADDEDNEDERDARGLRSDSISVPLNRVVTDVDQPEPTLAAMQAFVQTDFAGIIQASHKKEN